jgi:hypothetical protein
MPKAVRIQAVNADGKVIHEFPSIAAASAAGHCASTINRQLHHNGRAVDGLTWRRTTGPFPSVDRLAVLIGRLEAVAERIERAA